MSIFLQTANVRNLTAAMTEMLNRPAGVPSLAVVHGPAGRGKTEASRWYAVNKGGRYMVANSMWSEKWMLTDLYATLRGVKSAKFTTRAAAYEECLRLMQMETLPVFIDESDRIVGKTALLEAVRDLSDRTGVPVIFVGTDMVMLRLQQREQFASRLSEVVPFEGLTKEEVGMAARELYGLALGRDETEQLHRVTGGYFRDLVVALAHIYRAAKANGTTAPPLELVKQVAARAIKRAA